MRLRFVYAFAIFVWVLAVLAVPRSVSSDMFDSDLVPGVQQDKEGKAYIVADNGDRWFVYIDEKTERPFFIDPSTQEPSWFDPRTPIQEPPKVHKVTIDSDQWEKTTGPILSGGRRGGSSVTLALVVVIPVVLFIMGAAARIYYLHTYYPELLFPVRERRHRARGGGSGKFRATKTRGKMSQDGKGGRSANS